MKNYKYFPVVISAPSGGGKSTIKNSLLEKDSRFAFSITCTTRAPRTGEKEGVDYYFVTEKEFEFLKKKKELIEWAVVHGHLYGTPKKSVINLLEAGKIPLMTIDVKGAMSVKKIFKNAVTIFILPPDFKTMLERLIKRGETKSEIFIRMKTAKKELKEALKFDYLVINDKLEDAVSEIINIVEAEKCKLFRRKDFIRDFKKQLLKYSGGNV